MGLIAGREFSGDFQGDFRDARYGSLCERSLKSGDFSPKGSITLAAGSPLFQKTGEWTC